MLLNMCKIFFFVGIVFIELAMTMSQNCSQKGPYRIYDVVQSVDEFVEDVRTSVILQNIKSSLLEEDIVSFNQMSINDTFQSLDWKSFNHASDNKCMQDIQYIIDNINLKNLGGNQWALKMLDSFGKPESGMLEGNVKWLGDFKECRKIYAPKDDLSDKGGFHGKYCNAQISMAFLSISLGICVPDTCGPLDLMMADNDFLVKILSKLTPIPSTFVPELQAVTCKPNTRHLSSAAIVTIFLISIFLSLALIGSCITVGKYALTLKSHKNVQGDMELSGPLNSINQDSESNNAILATEESHTKQNFLGNAEPFFNCFCIFTNGAKLLNTDSVEGQLLCLHGIRFLSMSWVILCHLYMGSVNVIRNMLGLLPELNKLSFQVVLNGFFSVDSFFVLSGFLMAYLYFQEADKRKGNMSWKSWIYFYVHRYFRLTPVYMIVLAIYATLLAYFGSGPFWPDYDVDPNCHKSWWRNVLYINNFQKSADQCMGWSWYLGNDMQFFAISPLFLITLWKWPKIGYSLLALFFCSTWIASFVITYYYKLVPGGIGNVLGIAEDPTFMIRWAEYFDKIYTKPYTRIGPYLVGIVLALILFKRKQTNDRINFIIVVTGWTLASVLGVACVYGIYNYNPSLVVTSFYNSLSRTCFAVCLSWVIFACLSGYGGPVDKILSYKLFIPLSRLTYCAYLIHPLVVTGYFCSLKNTLTFSHLTMVSLFLGLMTITYAASLLISLIFESPLIRLEKLVLKKFRS